MATLNDQDHKVEYLFLLVGENPLPNYIAARTLLKDNGTVYLVFSLSTTVQKKCIEEGLSNQNQIKEIISIDLAKYESVGRQIYDRVKKKVPKVHSVGLNYTGGTKTMAVHAYKAIYEQRPDAIFSYIDSRHLSIRIDNNPEKFDIPIQISLKELFKLHNNNYWLDNKPPQFEAYLPLIAERLARIYSDKDFKKYEKQIENEINQLKKIISELEEDIEQEIQSTLNTLRCVPQTLADNLNSCINDLSNEINNNANQRDQLALSEIKKWINGGWLESYVLGEVKKIERDFHIKESGMNFYIKDPEYHNLDERNEEDKARFEFDVAFIKGYQLFAVSCATSANHRSCKLKLFEAHLRARQLGGDEARTALVCCSENPGHIEDEIRFAVRDKKIRVFGINQLQNLAENIKMWIEDTEKDQEEN